MVSVRTAVQTGTGGRLGPVLVCDPPPQPPSSRVLRDSGAGATIPTAPIFFLACLVEGGTMPLVLVMLPFLQPTDTPWQ